MDTLSINKAVEEAVTALQSHQPGEAVVQANATLNSFRSLTNPYEACQYIINHSSIKGAQFQALLTLRAAALREWPQLNQETKSELLKLTIYSATVQFATDNLLCSTAAGVAAALLKRAWGDMPDGERGAMLTSIDAVAKQNGSPQSVAASIRVLINVINEMNPITASAMGLPWDYHLKCCFDMQDHYLLGFLQHGIATAAGYAAGGDVNHPAMAASLSLIIAILSWDFKSHGETAWTMADQRPPDLGLIVRPPESWQELLLSADTFGWLAGLVLSKNEVGNLSRQLLVHLCALDGDVFQKDTGRRELGLQLNPLSKHAHVARMLSMLLPMISGQGAEAVCLDAGRGLLAASGIHRLSGFIQASEVAQQQGGASAAAMLQGIAQFSVSVFQQDNDFAEELSSILVDMWSELLIDPCRGAVAAPDNETANIIASVYGAALERELNAALRAVFEDEAEYEGDEEAALETYAASLATIGRAASGLVVPELVRRLKLCQSELQLSFTSQQDPSVTLEKLCWTLKMASSVIADSGDGEEPLIPFAIMDGFERFSSGPLIEMGHALFDMAVFCVENNHPHVSPRLMEHVVTALAQWADTYLLLTPDRCQDAALLAEFGIEGSKGSIIADKLVQLVNTALTRYIGERQLHTLACRALLSSLVRRHSTACVVLRCPAWIELCNAVASRMGAICELEAGVQRKLLQALCAAASGCSSENDAAMYISALCTPLVRECEHYAKTSGPEAKVASCVQSLRGAVSGARHGVVSIVHSFVSGSWEPLLNIFNANKADGQVARNILKFAADCMEYFGDIVSNNQPAALALLTWASSLTTAYSEHKNGAVDLAKSKSLAADLQHEQQKSLRAILRTLDVLTQLDFTTGIQIELIVITGLERLIPFISIDLLQFPKLRRQFFNLLAHVFEHYCQHVAALPSNCLQALNSAVVFGINIKEDQESVQSVLEAVAAVAAFHVMAIREGRNGFSPDALREFLLALLQRVLVDDQNTYEAVDYAAEAALPLILANTEAFIESSNQLGGVQGAFMQLASEACNECASLDRASRKKFRTSFRKFVIDTRAALLRR